MATTAGAVRGEREKCLAAGMDGYLSKPIRLADLHRALARWLPGPVSLPVGEPEAAAAAAVPGPDLAAGGREKLLQITGGDVGLLENIIEAFLRDMPAKLSLLKKSLGHGDAAGVRLQAHGMKSSGAFTGAVRFAELCRELENLAAGGTLQGAGELVADVEEEYRRVGAELRVFLDECRHPESK